MNVKDKISEHWLGGLLAVCATCVVAAWGASYWLNVAPRDFRIQSLERQIADLKDELRELKSERQRLIDGSIPKQESERYRNELAETKKQLHELRNNSVPRAQYEQLKQDLASAKSGQASRPELERELLALEKRADALFAENKQLRKQINADILGQIAKLDEQKEAREREINEGMAELRNVKAEASQQLQICEVCKADPMCPNEFKAGVCGAGARLDAQAVIIAQKVERDKAQFDFVASEIRELRSRLGSSPP